MQKDSHERQCCHQARGLQHLLLGTHFAPQQIISSVTGNKYLGYPYYMRQYQIRISHISKVTLWEDSAEAPRVFLYHSDAQEYHSLISAVKIHDQRGLYRW